MAMTESKCTPEKAVVIICSLEKLPGVFHFLLVGFLIQRSVLTG